MNLLNPCDFAAGEIITDCYCGRIYRVLCPDKRGMAKLHNLATGQDEDWNACNNRRFRLTSPVEASPQPQTEG